MDGGKASRRLWAGLRHSLSNWTVNAAKMKAKTVQGIVRHSRIRMTLDLYTQQDGNETKAAQGAYLRALRSTAAMVQ
jgi:integrase